MHTYFWEVYSVEMDNNDNSMDILSMFLRVGTFLERETIIHLVCWTLVMKRTLTLPDAEIVHACFTTHMFQNEEMLSIQQKKDEWKRKIPALMASVLRNLRNS